MKITFIGSNGAGKTTLLAALANLGSGGRKENRGIVTFYPESEDDVKSVQFRDEALKAAKMQCRVAPSSRNVSLRYILEVKDEVAAPKTAIELSFFDYVGEDFRNQVEDEGIKDSAKSIRASINEADAIILTFSAENFDQEKDVGVFASITGALNKIDARKKILAIVVTKADKLMDWDSQYGISQTVKDKFTERFPVLAELPGSFFAKETFALSCLTDIGNAQCDWSNPRGLDELFLWIVEKRREFNAKMARSRRLKAMLAAIGITAVSVGGFFSYSRYMADLSDRQDVARGSWRKEVENVISNKSTNCEGALPYQAACKKFGELIKENRYRCLNSEERERMLDGVNNRAREIVITHYVDRLLAKKGLTDFDTCMTEFKNIGLKLEGGYKGEEMVNKKRETLLAQVRNEKIRDVIRIPSRSKAQACEKIRKIEALTGDEWSAPEDKEAFENMARRAKEFFKESMPYVNIGKLAVGYESSIKTRVYIERDREGLLFRSKELDSSSPNWNENERFVSALCFDEQVWISVVRMRLLKNDRPMRMLRTDKRQGPIALLECIQEANESLMPVNEYVNPDDEPWVELRSSNLHPEEKYSLEIKYGEWTLDGLKTFVKDYKRFIESNDYWKSIQK